MSRVPYVFTILTTVLFLTTPAPRPLLAQASIDFSSGSSLMLGYTVKPPEQMFGAGAIFFPGGVLDGWGVLADGRFASNRPPSEELEPNRTPEQAFQEGDIFVNNRSSWNGFHLALVRAVGPELAIYAGGGLASETVYSQYTFERVQGEIIEFGRYWLEREDDGRTEPSFIVGAIYRMGSRLALQMGVQTAPRGFAVGGYLLVF
jgi:hypothetical protein